MTVLYFLRLWNTPPQAQAHYLQEKEGAYLSRHGRLAGMPKAASFASREVASLCIELWTPCLQLRWGKQFVMEVESVLFHGTVAYTPDADAATLLARGRSGRFASNQPIPAPALLAAHEELRVLGGQLLRAQ